MHVILHLNAVSQWTEKAALNVHSKLEHSQVIKYLELKEHLKMLEYLDLLE